MTHIVHQLADLTAQRDHHSLDSVLLSTLHDLLNPTRVTIAQLVGQAGREHWLTCADMHNGVAQPTDTEARAELEALPQADAFSRRQLALSGRQPVLSADPGGISVFPLVRPGGPPAVLELCTAGLLPGEHVRLITGVLRLYQNFQNLLDYGERDALTELLNRKTFDGAFLKATTEQQLMHDRANEDRRRPSADATHLTTGGGYWLALLDIDHFKQVNDNFGHLIGDEVLLLLARLMRNTFRFHDQLYRFGGEEFVVLMHSCSGLQTLAALQRLRSNTEEYPFPQVGRITVSIGYTELRRGDTPSGAFERADKAVYYAKKHGRNQVCGFEDLMAQGKIAPEPTNVGEIELF
ncbi:GGDEF domain-containing protein [Rhodoferax sp.]|uniref:GGDEF domain-containing protein n=1 Tax=Rhodoferax sp. TaxID=50421 RepID=UPI00260AA8E0|nr:GGDEF domain-containing protein [Rhodoferax sp.]MDD2925925.1 GGDEF domain-containing protein [Rhodoferax sp.]